MLINNYNKQKHSYRVHLQQLEQIYGMATPEADFNYYEFPDEFYEDEMEVWIDPLDGTKGFTEGHMTHITSLIGVSIRGRPRIGIIHKPFYLETLQMGRTYFGTPECGVFMRDTFGRNVNQRRNVTHLIPFPTEDAIDKDDYDLWVCGSMNVNQDTMDQLFKAWRPQNICRVAGMGNKCVNLIDQKSDVYLNLVPGIKNWDMCAGEALLQGMMGIICDSDHKPLIYDPKAEDYTIPNGIFVCKNKKVFDVTN